MKLEHIALSISYSDDIIDFYINILGMNEVKRFTLDKPLSFNIFSINKETPVFLLQKDELVLEIFVTKEHYIQDFNHICLLISEREALFAKANQNGYECIRMERNPFDLIFIKDRSGNIFEIKGK